MIIKEIISVLEEMAPTAYAEDFDNVGLLVGNQNEICTGVLVCHDALEEVIDEAIANNCNMVVCFHPILFSGLKKITGKNYVERAVLKAIKNDIAIFAVHTALDNHKEGVNKIMCNALGLTQTKILIPKEKFIKKLTTYTVPNNVDAVKHALFLAGAGAIGNYSECSFTSTGTGSFKPNTLANPTVGKQDVLEETEEIKIEVIFEKHLESKIIQALLKAHIYEEVAYQIVSLDNAHQEIGLGMIAELPQEMEETEFLQLVKDKMECGGIRHSALLGKKIKKVAVLGGSGSFAIKAAISQGADAFLTADLKYHQFYEAENKLLLCDIGHFESERFTKNYIFDYITKKIRNFAIILSQENTNPVKYF